MKWSTLKTSALPSIYVVLFVKITDRLLLLKCYDNKMAKSPFNWFILPLNQPEVANQQKKTKKKHNFSAQALKLYTGNYGRMALFDH